MSDNDHTPPLLRPFRLRVLDALTTCIEGVTRANGYQFDLAHSVFRGRLVFGDDDPIPMVAILESPNPTDPDEVPNDAIYESGVWPLFLQGFVKDDKLNPTDPGHLLMADVKKALVKARKQAVDFTILGFKEVTAMTIGGGIVRPGSQPGQKAYFYLPVTLKLAEDLEDPFH